MSATPCAKHWSVKDDCLLCMAASWEGPRVHCGAHYFAAWMGGDFCPDCWKASMGAAGREMEREQAAQEEAARRERRDARGDAMWDTVVGGVVDGMLEDSAGGDLDDVEGDVEWEAAQAEARERHERAVAAFGARPVVPTSPLTAAAATVANRYRTLVAVILGVPLAWLLAVKVRVLPHDIYENHADFVGMVVSTSFWMLLACATLTAVLVVLPTHWSGWLARVLLAAAAGAVGLFGVLGAGPLTVVAALVGAVLGVAGGVITRAVIDQHASSVAPSDEVVAAKAAQEAWDAAAASLPPSDGTSVS